jgi:Tfp pilus assembly protein PilN
MNFHKKGVSDLLNNSPIDFSVIFKLPKKNNTQPAESNNDNKLKDIVGNIVDGNNSPEINIWLLRFIIILIMFISIYSYNVVVINSRVTKNLNKIEGHVRDQDVQLNKITNDTNYIQEQIGQMDKYEQDIAKSKNDLVAQQSVPKGTYGINTILNEIMFIIPENTEITKLSTRQKTVTMDIQSKEYSQIGFFIATLRNQNLLKNIQITNPEFKDITKLTITGDLP